MRMHVDDACERERRPSDSARSLDRRRLRLTRSEPPARDIEFFDLLRKSKPAQGSLDVLVRAYFENQALVKQDRGAVEDFVSSVVARPDGSVLEQDGRRPGDVAVGRGARGREGRTGRLGRDGGALSETPATSTSAVRFSHRLAVDESPAGARVRPRGSVDGDVR